MCCSPEETFPSPWALWAFLQGTNAAKILAGVDPRANQNGGMKYKYSEILDVSAAPSSTPQRS